MSRAARRGRAAAVTAMLVFGLVRPVLAQPLRLELDAPASCATRESLRREVERRVGPGAREISARASIRPDGGGWVLDVAFDDGRRRLTGDSCVELAQTLSVILALAIDPGANAEATGGRPPVRSRPSPAQPSPRNEEKEELPAARPLRFAASALVFGETGALPGPTLGPGARVRLERGAWAAEVSGGYLLPRFAQLAEAPSGKGGDLSLWLVQAAACRGFLRGLLDVCAGGEAGELIGVGRGVTTELTGRALWTAVGIGLGAGAPLGAGTYGDARLSLAVPLRRPSFGLDGFDGRYRPSAVSGRILLGFGFR